MARILITGTHSFIGTNFRKYSKYADVEEISLRENLPESIDFTGIDTILHLAAIVHQLVKTPDSEYFRVNRDLTIRMAQQARKAGVRQFIFLSTVKVYGKWVSGSEPWNEYSLCFPEDPYGESKFEAEIALRLLGTAQFVVSIIRTPIVYGPGVGANILKLVRLIKKVPVLPFRSVSNNRHYIYVENLVGFIDRIIELRAKGVFVAMDNKALSTSNLVNLISCFMKRRPLMFKLPDFAVKTGVRFFPGIFDRLYNSFYLDNTETKQVLGYDPPYTIEQGFKKLITGYLLEKEANITTKASRSDKLQKH